MSTRKTTPTKRKTPVAKSVKKPAEPAARKVVAKVAAGASDSPEAMRKKEFIDNVVRRSGLKKKDAKPVVEAMLAELGETLATGRGLVLPPLGKLMINREKEMPDGRVLIVKVRQKNKLTLASPTKTAAE